MQTMNATHVHSPIRPLTARTARQRQLSSVLAYKQVRVISSEISANLFLRSPLSPSPLQICRTSNRAFLRPGVERQLQLPFFHPRETVGKMSQQALNKITPNSPSRAKPSEIETNIATALYELETNIPDMKSALRPLQFVSAREVRRQPQ